MTSAMSGHPPCPQPRGGAYLQPPCQRPAEGLVRATGPDGARMHRLPPNSPMPLFDVNGDVLYVKTADGAGLYAICTFRFAPVDGQPGDQDSWAAGGELLGPARQIEELKGALRHGGQSVSR